MKPYQSTFSDTDSFVREVVVRDLKEFGDSRAVQHLEQALEKEYDEEIKIIELGNLRISMSELLSR